MNQETIVEGLGTRLVYKAPEYNHSLCEFIKANRISDVLIYSTGWRTVEHFNNRLSILKAVIHCWIDKMPTP